MGMEWRGGRRASWIGLVLLVTACGTVDLDTRVGDDAGSTAAAPLRALVEEARADGQVPGLVVVVDRGGQLEAVASGTTTTSADGVPVGIDTVFQLGSIGKQFLSASVLRLVEQGRVSLDDPVRDRVPGFSHLPPTLQVRHLLNHTGGLREPFMLQAYRDGIEDLSRPAEDLVQILRTAPVDAPPGQRWSYSNSHYLLLALLVEAITGQPYEDALADAFFRPLGLASMRHCTPRPRDAHEAQGHVRDSDGNVVAAAPENMAWIRGDGGLCGSARDLARWTRLLASGAVVSPASYQQMIALTRLNDGTGVDYGFGLARVAPDGLDKVSHNGAMLGFSASAARYPERDVDVVVLANLGDVRTEAIERAVARQVLGVARPALPEVPVPAHASRLAGSFDIGVFHVRIEARTDGLWYVSPRPGPTLALRHVGDGRFVGRDKPDAIEVLLQPAGAPTRLRVYMGGMHWYGTRIAENVTEAVQ